MRKFSITLSIYSPRSYRYVRQKFENTLPHPKTIANWFAASDCNGEPGILTEAFKTIQNLANITAKTNKPLLGSLAFDEVAIRRHVQFDHQKKKWYGYIDQGKADDDGNLPIANNSLFFMLSILNLNVSIPIAYYNIKALDGYEKKNLLMNILDALYTAGVIVTNITFDGLSSNKLLCELLGVSFDLNNPKPYFIHPLSNRKIYIILDPCHMLKLLRNSLGDLNTITDPVRGKIEWVYFIRLEAARVMHKLVTHRLNKRHIQYKRNKMNVRLAAQTLSRSVASSMRALKAMGESNFTNSESTSYFAEQINDLFDTMNTKDLRNDGSGFKSALNVKNAEKVFKLYEEIRRYLTTLKFTRKFCVESRRKTGFIGFILNTISIESLYKEYVETKVLPALPTFYLSQDPLESFFSRVRSLHGSNDNPTVQQLKSAVRKLLFLNEVSSSDLANCEDNLNILTITAAKKSLEVCNEVEEDWDWLEENEDDYAISITNDQIYYEEFNEDDMSIETKQDATIAFFAGCVELRIEKSRFDCVFCRNIFDENEKIDGIFVENNKSRRPCCSTFYICKRTHEFFDTAKAQPNYNYARILAGIMNSISNIHLFKDSPFNHEDGEYHKKCLIDAIIDEYVRLYGTYTARCLTLEQQQLMLRNRNKRTTIFSGQ